MTKIIFSSFLLAMACSPFNELNAETASWLIEPVYSSITRMEEGFFKVKSGGKTGVFNKEGGEVVPASADSITNFSEGCALVLRISDAKYRLTGILHTDGTLTKIPSDKEWYAGEYAFFSDGLLPVCTKKGKYGFIDAEGKEKIEFEYGSVRPFCEGLAAVSKGKSLVEQGLALLGSKKKSSMFYIEKNGVPLNLPTEVGTISVATSFRFGEALVINTEGKRFVIDNSGRLVRMESGSRPLVFNEKYVVVQEGEGETVKSSLKISANGPSIFTKDGLHGYCLSGGQVVLPAQFSIAYPFFASFSIAKSPTGYGVLKLENGTVTCSLKKDTNGKTMTCTASLPSGAVDASYEFECVDADGISLRMPANVSNNGGSLQVSFPFSGGSGEYRLIWKGTHSELILWSETWPKEKENVTPASEHKMKSGTRGKKGSGGRKPSKQKEKKKEGHFA